MHVAFLLVALQGVGPGAQAPGDTLRPVPDSADMATAYADAGTRELVRLARGRRGMMDASVYHYTATSHQQISVGIRALWRERLLYRRETAMTVDWWRDRPSSVRVEGAREAVPVAVEGLRVPDELASWARSFVPEPGDDQLFAAPTENGFAWHPLVEGGEALYRYATGDSTVIQLQNGRRIRLVELRAIPRERDVRVVTGSFWIERDNHAIVQALFRPARSFDLERDLAEIDPGEEDELDDVPAFLKPIRFDVDYVTVDYGLWEMRWWMPRLMAFRGTLSVGPATLPFSFEVRYMDYAVEADPMGLPPVPPAIRRLAGDPTSEPRPYAFPIRVTTADSAALLASPLLVESFYADGSPLITEAELDRLTERLGGLPPTPWEAGRPRVTPPWVPGRGLVRYNRVEGLSVGARVDWDLGRARLDLTGRLGHADRELSTELGVEVPTLDRTWRLAGYRRLAVANPSVRALGLGNSVAALVIGRDDGVYYRSAGAELRVEPRDKAGYSVRVYGERQQGAGVHADFTVRELFGSDHAFRANIGADRVSQVGIDVTVGGERGLDPAGLRWGGWLDLRAETGTRTFARPGLTLRASGPLPGTGVLAALEMAGGTTFEDPTAPAPIQASWFLGGPGTLRGFDGGALAGQDYGRVRAELATVLPAARIALFSDAGWAGSADAFEDEEIGVSVGVGASLLDGLLRVDLARVVQRGDGYRLELYVDAIF